MKKTIKLISVLTVLTVISTAAITAETAKSVPAAPQTQQEGNNIPDRPMGRFGNGQHRNGSKNGLGFGRGPAGHFSENSIIGKVKKADLKSNILTVINTDGKEVNVAVTPFTNIGLCTEKQEGPVELKLADIKYDDWVTVAVSKTETKTPVAAFILVKKAPGDGKPDLK